MPSANFEIFELKRDTTCPFNGLQACDQNCAAQVILGCTVFCARVIACLPDTGRTEALDDVASAISYLASEVNHDE